MEIEITSQKQKFKEHINVENNNHIIFSGIFGIGKTYFIEKYFKEDTEFTPIYLSPVNYSISSNKDIINYIKYDIIFELLKMDINYKYEKIPLKFTGQQYVLENLTEIIKNLIKHTGQIGKKSVEIMTNLSAFYKKLEEHQDKHEIDEKRELLKFLKKITITEGSIYEENNITLLISSLLEQLKNPVLVIDDLDRLDPEHIFRILNVFACHLNVNGDYSIDDLDRLDPEHIFRILNVFACHLNVNGDYSNKFGFHKIILVCDIDNIKNIFLSKYGVNTDFNGYIDKFYSKQIFHFDNKKEIINNIGTLFRGIEDIENTKIFEHDKNANKVLKFLITELIENNCLNLRTLIKTQNYIYKRRYTKIIIKEQYKQKANVRNFILIEIFQFLENILGSKSNLEEILKKYNKKVKNKTIYFEVYTEYGDYRFNPFLFLIDYKKHKQVSGEYEYNKKEFNLIANYEIANEGYDCSIKNISYKNSENEKQDYFPYSKMLLEAFNIYSEVTFTS